MNRRNYNERALSIFELIGCYFVDIYYNHLYLTSKENNRLYGKSGSITDEYKNAVKAYLKGLQSNEKYYKKTVTGIHTFTQTYTRFTSITLVEFVNLILEQYLPQEHFSGGKIILLESYSHRNCGRIY
jgi:hypothetical protein